LLDHATNQAVSSKPLGWRLFCNETMEYPVCDGWLEMLAAGNFADWHSICACRH